MAVITVQLTTQIQILSNTETVCMAFFVVKYLFNVPGSRGYTRHRQHRHRLVLGNKTWCIKS